MPVREALQALEGEGLITIVPHRGATVLSLDAKRVGDIYDLRATLEVLLARSSLPNITNAAIADLTRLHDELRSAAERGQADTVFGMNLRFHHQIYRYSDNPEAKSVYDRYANLLRSLRGRYGFGAGRVERMIDEHGQILTALRAQDAAGLETVVRRHVLGAKQDLVARIEV
jgi:DNA-binding GntR family transcriptional regulator